ncbi:hydantoinase/oxoprolinase family protein [Salipiger abyssi]|uniref:hydantoinase/oxoprolinase family protein n=1 Tax=Salipiger abyssi TaxID=1250539 RepID=UPI001A8CF503|nr:hydantoinase/oxoprolinase family protein [Salipiger abyssi]MBN9887088.1 hydantoinase/oxoprolinase family protein [Salipiger abyssi]
MRKIGVDTGGTFTDCVLFDEERGRVVVEKVPSQPANPEQAILDGVQRVTRLAGLSLAEIDVIAHGTTIATNIVIEETYARAGVLATSGCRDVLEIGTQQRPQPYALMHAPKPVLVPRDLRAEVAGRVDAEGNPLVPLDEDAARAAVRALLAEGVEALAITGLFSFLAPMQERRAAAIAAEVAAEVGQPLYIVVSSDVSREVREFPRFATAAINASLAPKLDPYVRRLDDELRDSGFAGELLIMQSSGGIATAQRSMGERAHHLVLSGPAAGVVGGVDVCAQAGIGELITLDVGGTSADIGVVVGQEPRLQFEMDLPNGTPLQVPNLEIETIGAGGGSIAWIDAGGALQVGPRSAGARPGPVCFGLGGTEPTVTDAQVVLGRLNPAGLLAGGLRLDREAAVAAIATLADRLGMSVEDAAMGIVSVMEANMAGAIRRTAARNGDDLRDFTLVAAGGAGGLSVAALARDLAIPRVLVPRHPGLLSAAGLLNAPLRHDLTLPILIAGEALVPDDLLSRQAALEAEVARALHDDGMPAERCSFGHALDIRYFGQEFSVTTPVTPGEAVADILDRFHVAHERVYGHSAPGDRTEVTALRVNGAGAVNAMAGFDHAAPAEAKSRTRRVWFAEAAGYVDTPVVPREALVPGDSLTGPAIVEQLDTTIVLPPGRRAQVDPRACLIIEGIAE